MTAVPTMRQSLPSPAGWTVNGAQVVELRCEGGESAVRVRFVLGEEGARAADVLPAAWVPDQDRTALDAEVIGLELPRLELRTLTDVTPHLAAFGISYATSPDADFSGLSPEPLAIDQVVQEAVVKVAELGVEAAAVTAIAMRAAGAPAPAAWPESRSTARSAWWSWTRRTAPRCSRPGSRAPRTLRLLSPDESAPLLSAGASVSSPAELDR